MVAEHDELADGPEFKVVFAHEVGAHWILARDLLDLIQAQRLSFLGFVGYDTAPTMQIGKAGGVFADTRCDKQINGGVDRIVFQQIA